MIIVIDGGMIGPRIDTAAVSAAAYSGVVAVVVHHPDHDGAGAGGVGERRAADAREERDREDVGVPEAAAKAADELRREAQQHLRQRAAGHQLGGQDEERHRHQREHVDAAEQVFRAARSAAGRRRGSPRASRRRARTPPARRAPSSTMQPTNSVAITASPRPRRIRRPTGSASAGRTAPPSAADGRSSARSRSASRDRRRRSGSASPASSAPT